MRYAKKKSLTFNKNKKAALFKSRGFHEKNSRILLYIGIALEK